MLAKATAVVTLSRPVSLSCSSVFKHGGIVEDVSTTNPEAYSASLANVVCCFFFLPWVPC